MLRSREKILVSFLCFIFLTVLCEGVNAATRTWDGEGATPKASNNLNWSDNTVPVDGDSVIFDGTSSDDCDWDLSVTLVSFTTTTEYEGEITQRPDEKLIIAEKVFIWTATANGDASDGNNWSQSAAPQTGDAVVFNRTSSYDCTWDLNVSPFDISMRSLYDGTVKVKQAYSLATQGSLRVDDGTLDLNNEDLDVEGDLIIGSDGTINATRSEIRVAGDWKNKGTFIAGTSRVFLDGVNQTIYGDTTFFWLEKTVDYADTLKFEAGSVQTITFRIFLRGLPEPENRLRLRSTDEGSENPQYYICTPVYNNYIEDCDVKHMVVDDETKCSQVSEIQAVDSTNSGGNSGIDFLVEGEGIEQGICNVGDCPWE